MDFTTVGIITRDNIGNMRVVAYTVQNDARIACTVPKNMKPSKETFEDLGFNFEKIEDDALYQATLPEDWTIEPVSNNLTYLIDEKGRKRGFYYYKNTLSDGQIHLMKRYCCNFMKLDPDDSDSPVKVFVADADGTIIFEAGHCIYNSLEYILLMEKAKNYLNSKYPDWENVRNYWD